jgi:uncharacterized membrane protein YfcA
VLLAASGVLAGIVNTIAGGGTFLSLPLLVLLGLSPKVANATVRVGILFQNLVATLTFRQRGVREGTIVLKLVVPVCAGAWLGSLLAARVEEDALRRIFGAVLLLWAVVLLVRPGSFLSFPPEPRAPGPGSLAAAFGIGIYAGFLQAGVGFPLMILLVSGLGYSPVRANAVKVALILVSTAVASIPVFAWEGLIAWREAFLLAAGTMLGGWIGTRWQIRAGARLVRWFLVVTVTLSGVLMMWG